MFKRTLVRERRRFHFDNAFKRVLHTPTGEVPKPTDKEKERGYIAFVRDPNDDVYHNDRPLPGGVEDGRRLLSRSAYADERNAFSPGRGSRAFT